MDSLTGRILVVGASARAAGTFSARLARYGLQTNTASGVRAMANQLRNGRYAGVVIDAADMEPPQHVEAVKQARESAAPYIVPVIVVIRPEQSATHTKTGADVTLRHPIHPAQLSARIQMAARVAIMEDEVRLRAGTLRRFAHTIDLSLNPADYKAAQVLFVGHPSPFFLGLERSIRQQGASITAAFSTFTAFDYLHERDFDAVVCSGLNELDPVFVIANAFRRNTRLFHTPLCLFVDLDDFDDSERIFEAGFSDILDARGDTADMSGRVLSLARERRRRETVRKAFLQIRDSAVTDAGTQLATPDFFAAHLYEMTRRNREVARDMTLIVVRAVSPRRVSVEEEDKALKQFGSMISHLIRVEDFAARIERRVFAIAMPGTTEEAGRHAVERIEAIASCTAFDAGDLEAPFQLTLSCSVVQRHSSELADALLSRALDEVRAMPNEALSP
jgi:two-component system cell cycle response regulator PopA